MNLINILFSSAFFLVASCSSNTTNTTQDNYILTTQISKNPIPHICLRNETSHTLEIFVNNEPEILGPKETISVERPLNGTFIVQLDTQQTSIPKAEPHWEEASTQNVMVEGCNSMNTVIVTSKKRPSDENALAMNL